MKHQFFFFLLLHSFSAYAMQPEQNNITKNQLINRFTAFNYQMKQLYPDTFDAKEFGWFIVGLREMKPNEFESHKEELLNMMKPLNLFEQEKLG